MMALADRMKLEGDLVPRALAACPRREGGGTPRSVTAGDRKTVKSPIAREGALVATHMVDSRLILAQDAVITAKLMENLPHVIESLQPTKDAVIRIGALLIVKVDWVVTVHQLTAAQQAMLDHQPQLPHLLDRRTDLPAAGDHVFHHGALAPREAAFHEVR